MPKRADVTAMNSLFTELQNLKALRATFLAQGDTEVADAIQRAMRELQHPSVANAANQVPGAAFDVSRP
jgi:hypothetical protein